MIRAGESWYVSFSTDSLGTPLAPGAYRNVQRAGFTDPGRAGLDIEGDGRGCNEVGGKFTVTNITADADASQPGVQSLLIQFEQHCEDGTSYNVGCVHFTL